MTRDHAVNETVTIIALYGAQGGECVFDVRGHKACRQITVAEGEHPLTGRIAGLSGWVDAYICWFNDEPEMRVPAWSVSAHYEMERSNLITHAKLADLATTADCLIESTCGHALKSGDSFYAYRDSPSWHWNPDFTGRPYGDSAGIEILCRSCHDARAQKSK